MSLPKQTRGAECVWGGRPVQSEHKSGSSLMSSTKKKKKIKLHMRKNLSVVISESRRYQVCGEHFQFSNLTNGRGEKKKPFPGPIFNAEKGINPVWVTHNTVKTVSSSLEVRILFVR